MGKKRLVTDGIRIRDIFDCYSYTWLGVHGYYEVTAFRGRTLVVLREVKFERYTNRGISEDSELYWRRERTRPLPGQFLEGSDPFTVHADGICDWNGKKRLRRSEPECHFPTVYYEAGENETGTLMRLAGFRELDRLKKEGKMPSWANKKE